jgi:hypothetical protein
MGRKKIRANIIILLILPMLSPIGLYAMENFGQSQQKELLQYRKQLFRALKTKNGVEQINAILGEDANMPESYRSVLLESKCEKSQKTLLQKAYPAYIPRSCAVFGCYGDCGNHRHRCGAHFLKLLELGADIKQISAEKLLACLPILKDHALKPGKAPVARALFSYSLELNALLLGEDHGNKLLKEAISSNKIDIFKVLLEQPMVNIIGVKEFAENTRKDTYVQLIDNYIKERNTKTYHGSLINIIQAGNWKELSNKLKLFKDDKTRVSEANAALAYAYALWLESKTAEADLLRTKIIGILIKAGATFKQFKELELKAYNSFNNYNLLHSAAHLGGVYGEALAQAVLSYSLNLARILTKAKSKQQESPLQVAINYQSQLVIEALKNSSGPQGDSSELSQTFQSLESNLN